MIPPRTILLACDFSSASDRAIEQASRMAEQSKARLVLLHVLVEKRFGLPPNERIDERRRVAEERLLQILNAKAALKLDFTIAVRDGSPAREIAACAIKEGADLIVMGTQGRSGLAHATLGSVAEKVLRTTDVPVLVVRGEPAAPLQEVEDAAARQWDAVASKDDLGPALDLLSRARALRATDVHIDPWGDDEYAVRFRIDGRLERYCTMGADIALHLIQRYKLLANLDIADPFRPKEGRLKVPPKLADLEVRLTTSPVAGGEAAALRLFSRESLFRPLTGLGLSTSALATVDAIVRHGEGLVLVTGPTGSGKTSTVYSMLAELSRVSRNIVSIEDPVEYHVPFVRQMAVDERHGLTMTVGLKTLMRMDPDVVFVGEIRDLEAAEISMRAASSGRYVFSTLHTRDVASTVTACRDLRVDNRSLSGNLTGIVNQRLVRRLCQHCRQPRAPDEDERRLFQMHGVAPPDELFRPQGCQLCEERGQLGRIGVFEAVLVDDTVREAIARGAAEAELRQLLRSRGAASLLSDALNKARDGVVSLEEALSMSAV